MPLKTASETSRLTGCWPKTAGFLPGDFPSAYHGTRGKHHAQTHETACEGYTDRRHRRQRATAGGCRRGRLLNGFGGLNDIERGGPCYIGGVEYGSCVSKNRIGFAKYAKDCIR